MPFRRLLVLMLILVFLITVIQLKIVTIAFGKLGLSQESAYLLLLTTLLGSMINLPLYSVPLEKTDIEPAQRDANRVYGLSPQLMSGRTVVAVNVGGAVTPAAFSLYLFLHNPIPPLQAISVVAIVAAAAHWASFPIRGVGIAMFSLVAPFVAAGVSIMLNPELAAPLAYIGGTLGVLIGADLLRLGAIRKLGAPFASIGGAGTFDGIFLTGVLAVLLA